jgi:hypothetical protein
MLVSDCHRGAAGALVAEFKARQKLHVQTPGFSIGL